MIPERFSDEWFEMMQDWEGENHEMVQEYHWFQKYRDTQGQLEEFPKGARHRIYSGG